MNIQEKDQKLRTYISELESLAVAFSSGVDSTFLLKPHMKFLETG